MRYTGLWIASLQVQFCYLNRFIAGYSWIWELQVRDCGPLLILPLLTDEEWRLWEVVTTWMLRGWARIHFTSLSPWNQVIKLLLNMILSPSLMLKQFTVVEHLQCQVLWATLFFTQRYQSLPVLQQKTELQTGSWDSVPGYFPATPYIKIIVQQ